MLFPDIRFYYACLYVYSVILPKTFSVVKKITLKLIIYAWYMHALFILLEHMTASMAADNEHFWPAVVISGQHNKHYPVQRRKSQLYIEKLM